jgi:hypothetical protein
LRCASHFYRGADILVRPCIDVAGEPNRLSTRTSRSLWDLQFEPALRI